MNYWESVSLLNVLKKTGQLNEAWLISEKKKKSHNISYVGLKTQSGSTPSTSIFLKLLFKLGAIYSLNVLFNSPVKPSGPEVSFSGRLLAMIRLNKYRNIQIFHFTLCF